MFAALMQRLPQARSVSDDARQGNWRTIVRVRYKLAVAASQSAARARMTLSGSTLRAATTGFHAYNSRFFTGRDFSSVFPSHSLMIQSRFV